MGAGEAYSSRATNEIRNEECQLNQIKTVIVTGASRGIGKAIALSFAKRHWNVVILASKSASDLEKTKQEIESHGAHCLSLLGDVSDPEFVSFVMEETKKRFSTVHCLVNNAGISYIGLITDMSNEDWNQILNTNLSSVFYFSRAVVPMMLQEQDGCIINISSVWGEIGASCEVAYSATKGGINAFTKALAKELAPSHIKVNAISCGAIHTSMNEWLSKEEEDALIDEIPAGRLGEPEEIAEFAYSLTESSYLTGQIIRMDGGWI